MLQGAEEGEELAGSTLGGSGAAAGASAGKAASAGATWAGSEGGGGSASSAAEEAAATSRAQLQKLRRRAKQEVLKIDKQRRIELVKQGKSAYELRALAAAEVRRWHFADVVTRFPGGSCLFCAPNTAAADSRVSLMDGSAMYLAV